MSEPTDRDLLITLIKDMAEVKTIVRDYRNLEEKVNLLQQKLAWFTGASAVIGGTIVAMIQQVIS